MEKKGLEEVKSGDDEDDEIEMSDEEYNDDKQELIASPPNPDAATDAKTKEPVKEQKEEKKVPDFISPAENDDYHDHILNLLKIKNNPNLNKFFYEKMPVIKKIQLIETDLSIDNEQTKKIIEELVPTSLLSKRMCNN